METVKMSSKGQIVIPKSLRESHGLKTGTEFIISSIGEELRLSPAPLFEKTTVREVGGVLARPGRQHISDTDTDAAIGALLLADDEASKHGHA